MLVPNFVWSIHYLSTVCVCVCVCVCSVLKKVKHRLVEKMKDSTADTLGLSRAVLVNGEPCLHRLQSLQQNIFPDKLVKKVQYLESNAKVYRGVCVCVFEAVVFNL